MHHPMPCHHIQDGQTPSGSCIREIRPTFFSLFSLKGRISLSTPPPPPPPPPPPARYAPHVLSSLSSKRKNWSLSARYAPNSPSDLEGNHQLTVDPLFFDMRPHSMGETRFFVVLKNHLKKRFGVATYFCFILKRKNKIRKKNPKYDS